jgi:hypothetical protein
MAFLRYTREGFDLSDLLQAGVQVSYNEQPRERPPLHTSVAEATAAAAAYLGSQPRPGAAAVAKEEWYKTDRFYQVVRKFHDTYARQPDMSAAKETHERFKEMIERELRKMDICKRLEYKGSSYEGVKVKKSPIDNDLEFDIMVIMVDSDKLVARSIQNSPGFVRLYTKKYVEEQGFQLESLVVGDGEQLSEKVGKQFFGAVQKCINNCPEMKDRVLLRRHGPTATQMDVYTGRANKSAKLYSVDLVPSYEVGDKIYLAKPLDDRNDSPMVWRECFSLQEKLKLNGIDRGNECRKEVLRVLKTLRNGRSEMQKLSSYHLKTALFYVVDEQPSWNYNQLGERVVDVLKKLEDFLKRGFMHLYFLKSANLFKKFSQECISNLRDRIHDMCTKEVTLVNMMEFYGRPYGIV